MKGGLGAFLAETRRRKVTRVAVAYVVGGIAAVEGAQILGQPLGLPPGLIQAAAFLVIIGFPIALVLAWALDVTPEGIRRTEPLAPDALPRGAAGWWTPGRAVLAETALVVALIGGYVFLTRPAALSSAGGRVPIAVLPFANLSGGEDAEALTNGIHDDILTQLSKIHSLRVTSRTSVMEYRNEEHNLRRIGEELGVTAILEGGVQKDQDRIRINAQLIDTETDEHLWAETYDRSYTMGGLFAIQSDIAEKIAEALRAILQPEEARRIAALPTRDTVAYGLYLRGKDLYARSPAEHEAAMALFRQAIRVDPRFAAAYAYIAFSQYRKVQDYGYPIAYADSVMQAARKAVELDPELSRAHYALGVGYWLLRRTADTRAAWLRALELDPGDSGALQGLGVMALDLGRYDEADAWLNRALEVDPRDVSAHRNLGYTSRHLERFEEAALLLGRAEALGGAAATLTNFEWVQLDLAQGNVAEARRRAEAYAAGHPGDPIAVGALANAAMAARDAEAVEALMGQILAQAPDWGLGAIPAETRIARAWALRELGRRDEAARLLADAGAWLQEALSRYGPQPDLLFPMAARSAVAGEAEDALRWLQQAADAGYADVGMLRMDPRFDALASDARFTALLGRMEADVAAMRGRVERGEVDLRMGPGT